MNIKPTAATKVVSARLSADRKEYSISDVIKLEVSIKNDSEDQYYFYNEFDWGESSSFSLWVKDIGTGKDVVGKFLADALPPPPSSKEQFTKLAPGYFLGFASKWSMKELNIDKPGNYLLEVVYHSPIPSAFAFGLPVWGKEKGEIKSNAITLHIVGGGSLKR